MKYDKFKQNSNKIQTKFKQSLKILTFLSALGVTTMLTIQSCTKQEIKSLETINPQSRPGEVFIQTLENEINKNFCEYDEAERIDYIKRTEVSYQLAQPQNLLNAVQQEVIKKYFESQVTLNSLTRKPLLVDFYQKENDNNIYATIISGEAKEGMSQDLSLCQTTTTIDNEFKFADSLKVACQIPCFRPSNKGYFNNIERYEYTSYLSSSAPYRFYAGQDTLYVADGNSAFPITPTDFASYKNKFTQLMFRLRPDGTSTQFKSYTGILDDMFFDLISGVPSASPLFMRAFPKMEDFIQTSGGGSLPHVPIEDIIN